MDRYNPKTVELECPKCMALNKMENPENYHAVVCWQCSEPLEYVDGVLQYLD